MEGIRDGSLQCLVSTGSLKSGPLETKSPACRASTLPSTPVSGEPVTPPSKAGRRSFWDMLVMEGSVVKWLLSNCLPQSCSSPLHTAFPCIFSDKTALSFG